MRLSRALGLIAFLAAGAAAGTAQADSWLTGRVLVASENMPDPRFQETVIYLVDHDENGAFGLIVNKPISTGPVEGLLDRLGIDLDDKGLGALRGGFGSSTARIRAGICKASLLSLLRHLTKCCIARLQTKPRLRAFC